MACSVCNQFPKVLSPLMRMSVIFPLRGLVSQNSCHLVWFMPYSISSLSLVANSFFIESVYVIWFSLTSSFFSFSFLCGSFLFVSFLCGWFYVCDYLSKESTKLTMVFISSCRLTLIPKQKLPSQN